MISNLIIFFILTVFYLGAAPEEPTLKPSELHRLTAENWKGKLTYKDYSNNKEVEIPTELIITESDSNISKWNFIMSYPDEPHMNNSSVVKLDENGKEFDGEIIIEKKYLPDSTLYFVTEVFSEDNNRKAFLRHIYTIGNSEFKIRKEVRYEEETDYFFRNEYEFIR